MFSYDLSFISTFKVESFEQTEMAMASIRQWHRLPDNNKLRQGASLFYFEFFFFKNENLEKKKD